MRKNYYLIIDTETANGLEQPMPYDIGYAICDRTGNIFIERSFIVAEIFLDNKEMMNSAYYANKIPKYWDDIQNGTRIIKSIFNIRKQIKEDIKKYHVNIIGAYNMNFDKNALNNVIRYCSKSKIRWFFPFGMKYICIWNMACQTIMNTKSYIKFALQNDLVSQANNIQTSAESCFKFITDNIDFSENHTGLEDVKIEIAIMIKCFDTHKKMNQSINRLCWQIPQNKRKLLFQ